MFDLLVWLLPKVEQLPKAYQFILTQSLIDAALDLQDALVEAETSTVGWVRRTRTQSLNMHGLVRAVTHRS